MSEEKKSSGFLDEIYNTVGSRIKHPITGTFIITWLIVNWESILIVLLSDESVDVVIQQVKQNTTFVKSLVYPILGVAIYNIFLPYISNLIDIITLWSVNLKIGTKFKQYKKQLDEELKVVEDELEVSQRRSGALEKKELQEQLLEKTEQFNTLNSQVTNLEKELTIMANRENEAREKLLEVESKNGSLRTELKEKSEENSEINEKFDDVSSKYERLVSDSSQELIKLELKLLPKDVVDINSFYKEYFTVYDWGLADITKSYTENTLRGGYQVLDRIRINKGSLHTSSLNQVDKDLIDKLLRRRLIIHENNNYSITLKGVVFIGFMNNQYANLIS